VGFGILREILVGKLDWVIPENIHTNYHLLGGNEKLTPLPPSDVLIHLLLSETIFSLLPPPVGRNFLRGEIDR
jgi:hypothetical protein